MEVTSYADIVSELTQLDCQLKQTVQSGSGQDCVRKTPVGVYRLLPAILQNLDILKKQDNRFTKSCYWFRQAVQNPIPDIGAQINYLHQTVSLVREVLERMKERSDGSIHQKRRAPQSNQQLCR